MVAATAAETLLKGTAITDGPVSVVWANTHGLPVFLKMLEGLLRIRSGNTEELPTLIEQLRQGAHHESNYFKGVADYLEGLLAQYYGDTGSALRYLRQSKDIFDTLETSFESTLARLEWSTIAIDDHANEALLEAQKTLAGFRRLGAKSYLEVTEQLTQTIQASLRDQSSQELMPQLSERERQIIECVACGLSNKQIAEQLVLSHRTVSTHLDKIYRKFNVHSRTALVRKLNDTLE